MKSTHWVGLFSIFLTVQLCVYSSPGADAMIMTRRIRRIVRRLDRSANDVLDHVEDSLEHDKGRSEHRGRRRSRGRSRSRSHGLDLGGLGGIARPIIRQVLGSKRGLLGKVGVKANLDNGQWNVNLKIGGRKPGSNHATDKNRGNAKTSVDTKGGSGRGGKGQSEHGLGHLGGVEWPGSKGLPPNLASINLHGLGHSSAGYAHSGGSSIGSVHGGGHFPAGGVALGSHQGGGWQPSPSGYQAGANTANNNGWLFRKRSSEKDDSDWSLESKEDEVFTRPRSKVTTTTSTTRRPASKKQAKGSNAHRGSSSKKHMSLITEANDVWDDSRQSRSSEGESKGSSREIKQASALQVSQVKEDKRNEPTFGFVRQRGSEEGQLGPLNIRIIPGVDGSRQDHGTYGRRPKEFTHEAATTTAPLTAIWAAKPWNVRASATTTPEPLWTTNPRSVQSIIGREVDNAKATHIHIDRSESNGQSDKPLHAGEELTGNRWQLATPGSSEESAWLRRVPSLPGLQTSNDNTWTPVLRRTSPENTPAAAAAAASETIIAVTPPPGLGDPTPQIAGSHFQNSR